VSFIKPKPHAPTLAELMDLWTRVVPDDFWRAMQGDPSEAVFRGLAAEMATLGSQADRGVQARFILPSALQRFEPATLSSRAEGTVTVERQATLELAMVVPVAALRFTSSDGARQYFNGDALFWWPGEGGAKDVRVVCDVEGFVGNLDFEANPDGSLDLDLFTLVPGQDRSNDGSVPMDGVLQDTGYPDVLAPELVGQYLEITAATFTPNIGVRRITGFSWPQTESPPSSGLYPRQVTLDTQIWLRSPEPMLYDSTAVTYTDYYAQAWQGGSSIPLFGAVPAVGDAFLFTQASPFDSIVIDILDGAGDWTVSYLYWNGVSYQPLPSLSDPTLGWTVPGKAQVSWGIPADWTPEVSPLSGLAWYTVWVELTALVVVVTAPTFDRVSTIETLPVRPDTAVSWQVLDYGEDLGLTITAIPQAPTGGRDNDLYLLGDNRGVYRQAGEDQETFRQRIARLTDVVSPNAIQRVVNRALEPLGLTGLAVDVSSTGDNGVLQYPGLFFDVPTSSLPIASAFDMYAAGDVYPQIDGMLLLDTNEAWGWFFVLVPYSDIGEFGAFYDEGPVVTDWSETLVDAFESCFFDGYPVTYYGILAGITGAINAIKAGGVGWTLVRSELLT
jgi:hypothetical protein